MGVRDLATTLKRLTGGQPATRLRLAVSGASGFRLEPTHPSVGGSVNGLSLPPRCGRSLDATGRMNERGRQLRRLSSNRLVEKNKQPEGQHHHAYEGDTKINALHAVDLVSLLITPASQSGSGAYHIGLRPRLGRRDPSVRKYFRANMPSRFRRGAPHPKTG